MTRFVPVLLAVIGGATLLGAQQPTFRGGTHTVSVYATVVDRNGRLVPNLTKDDFEVYDNGKLQTLTVFKNDIQPITIVIMLDRSGSMKGNFPIERAAAQQFIAELLPDDKARLGSFSHRVQIDPRDFTSDRNELTRILRENLLDGGPTPLWNATYAAMNALAHEDGRRVVLVFTDGYDSPERGGRNYTLDDVITRSQAEEIMVYAIGLSDPCEGGRPGSDAELQGSDPRLTPSPAPHATTTVRQKNSCASPACPIEIAVGNRYRTVNPPSTPWRITVASAMSVSFRIHGRRSTRQVKMTSPIVRKPTALAMSRWPCS